MLSFTLFLWDSTSLFDTVVHIAEHSPVWHYAIRKLLLIIFNHRLCVTIAKAIYVHNVIVFIIWKCSQLNPFVFLAPADKTELHVTIECLMYDVYSHGELSENVFLWLHITLKWFTVGHTFVVTFWTKITQRTCIFTMDVMLLNTLCVSTQVYRVLWIGCNSVLPKTASNTDSYHKTLTGWVSAPVSCLEAKLYYCDTGNSILKLRYRVFKSFSYSS
jgi:hypothetical protein